MTAPRDVGILLNTMADILHDFFIAADTPTVFAGCATPAGLDTWWTLTSSVVVLLGDVPAIAAAEHRSGRARRLRAAIGRLMGRTMLSVLETEESSVAAMRREPAAAFIVVAAA
jgi:hypothetical protein